MKKNTDFFKAMKAIEREMLDGDFMQYDSTAAYNTEDLELASDDWTAMQDIFGTNDNAMERYAEGMVDGNICYRI